MVGVHPPFIFPFQGGVWNQSNLVDPWNLPLPPYTTMTTSVPSSESNTASSSSMEDGSSDNHIDNHIGQQQQRQPQTTNTGSFHSLQRPLHSSLLTSLPQSPSASAAANLFYQQPQYSQSTSALSPMFVLHDPATRLPLARKEDDKDFHHTFLKIPNTDHLIKSYSAAYQSDVLVQGRFWVSQHHVAWRGW